MGTLDKNGLNLSPRSKHSLILYTSKIPAGICNVCRFNIQKLVEEIHFRCAVPKKCQLNPLPDCQGIFKNISGKDKTVLLHNVLCIISTMSLRISGLLNS